MTQRILAGAFMAGTLCLLAATASAQQAAPTPTPSAPAPAPAPAAAPPAGQAAPAALPPGSPLIGRPANSEAAAKLAPVPAPPLAADKIPLDKLKAPKGFNLELYASGMPTARSLALSDKGTVFVGSRLQDKVYAITTDKDGKRKVHVLVSGLYRPNGVAFVARHGSWNRTVKFGGDIALVKLNKDGSVKSVEPFITGFLQNNNYVGRPVDIMNMPDGSMLISDDWNGAVYRLSYGPSKKIAGR
jgi:glucose/arabinose dehydrogenase